MTIDRACQPRGPKAIAPDAPAYWRLHLPARPSPGTAPSRDGGYAHYGAAKAAIAHYTRYLAQDLGPFGITANCIAPGVIATGRIMATVLPGSIQSNQDRSELVALRRLGTVEDCARVVEFLATDLSDYVTGAVIPVDGGLVRG
jgi:3-oxoacyl-[acyl-carrier protein] reductase